MQNRTLALLLLAGMLLAGGACKRRQHRAQIQQTEEEPPQMATTVHMADPRSALQLASGFYDIEQNAWRWTAGQFAVVLRTPRGAAQKGAVLRLQFALPAVVVGRLKSITMAASIGGVKLTPETYTQSGEYVFTRDVPPRLLGGETTRVEFSLDKFLPGGMVESRELGVIASSAGLEPK